MPTAPQITTADLSEESSTTALLRAAIGPVNTRAYLPVFTQFDMLDRSGLSWNWAAALCTLNWMAYRQLWSAALLYAGAVVGAILLIFGIGRLVFQFSEGVELGLLMAFAAAAVAVPGLYGNALLYAATRKKMAAALASTTTLPEACTLLQRRAPSRLRLLLLALANVVVLGAAVAGFVELPHPGAVAPSAPVTAVAAGAAVTPASVAPPPLPAPVPTPTPVAQPEATPVADPSANSPAPTSASPTAPAPAPTSAAAAATSSTASSVAPTPAAVATRAPVVPTVAPAPVEAKAKAKPNTQKAKPAPPSKATPEARFYVNVGLFADANNALNTYVKLTDAGLAATKLEFNTSKGKRTRVRVGPFSTEGQAVAAIEKIRAMGLEAVILRPE